MKCFWGEQASGPAGRGEGCRAVRFRSVWGTAEEFLPVLICLEVIVSEILPLQMDSGKGFLHGATLKSQQHLAGWRRWNTLCDSVFWPLLRTKEWKQGHRWGPGTQSEAGATGGRHLRRLLPQLPHQPQLQPHSAFSVLLGQCFQLTILWKGLFYEVVLEKFFYPNP